MCFLIHHKHQDPKIAKRNVVCYKYLTPNWSSMHQHFKYERGVVYETELVVNIYITGTIHEGFHSYSKRKKFRHILTGSLFKQYKCVIPKGSTYYYNPEYEEYVSNQIIVKKCVS